MLLHLDIFYPNNKLPQHKVEYLLLFLFRLRFRDRLLELVPFLRERGIFADVRQRETLVVLRDFTRRG